MSSQFDPETEYPSASSRPWKPWSILTDPATVQRKMCGLLNKIVISNFDLIAGQFVQLSVSAQRNGAFNILDIIAKGIVERSLWDESRCGVYAELCQTIEGELNKEYGWWTAAIPCGQEIPSLSFLPALRSICHVEFDRLFGSRSLQLYSLMHFVGELLLQDIFIHEDVHRMLGVLLYHAQRNDERSAIALCRFSRDVIEGPDGRRRLEQLAIAEDIDTALEEDTIVAQIRYMLMGILDLATQPDLIDVFDSIHSRAEIYGLNSDEDEEEEPDVKVASDAYAANLEAVCQSCEECTRTLIAARSLSAAEEHFKALSHADRHILVDCLVHAAIFSNDVADARLVSSLFARPSIRPLVQRPDTFRRGFIKEVELLEDTILDVPNAYHLVAIMLHACAMTHEAIEAMASKIIHPNDHGRDRLLDAYYSLGVETSDIGSFDDYDNRESPYGTEGDGSDAIAVAY